MDLELASIEKIQDLLKRDLTVEHRHDEITCCSVADVFLAVERMKKSGKAYDPLTRIKDQKTAFFEAVVNGDLLIASLDTESLQDGLFNNRTQLWEPAANHGITPTHSVRLVTLKSFDLRWDSDMIEEAQRIYGE